MTTVPTHLDRFKIVRVLGRGGMGTVYLAKDERLDRLVALKVLSSEVIPDKERTARFLREARAAAAIRHPNIATIYEVGETGDGIPFIAMEYCEGETLSQISTDRKIDATTWLMLAKQISEGIAAAHGKGILHRDIKSANIIIEENRLAKVLDFGLAKVLETNQDDGTLAYSSSGRFFGTVPYISPEQARGGTADIRSDLF
jgi:Serine/threonine protein kinase